MRREDATDEIKRQWEEVMGRITSPAKEKKNGKISYICPLCEHGKSGDGITEDPNKPGKIKCFGKCGTYDDIIGWVQIVKNVGFDEALRWCADILGIEIDKWDGGVPIERENQVETAPSSLSERDTPQIIAECQALIRGSQRNIEDPACVEYLTWRGISLETAKKYGLGFDPAWSVKEGKPTTPRIIIPTSEGHYIARSISDNTPKEYRVMNPNSVTARLWGFGALYDSEVVFVCEGAFDALTVAENGYGAVALNSVSNASLLLREIDANGKPNAFVIVCTDADEAGRGCAERISSELTARNIPHKVADISETETGCKDINELWMKDRETARRFIKEQVQGVTKTVTPSEGVNETDTPSEVPTPIQTAPLSPIGTNPPKNEQNAYLSAVEGQLSAPPTVKDKRLSALATCNSETEFARMISRFENPDFYTLIPTGFSVLDKVFDGGLYEGLFVVGGKSSVGKTAFVNNMGDKIAKNGNPVLFMSLEMTREQIIARSISRITAEYVRREEADEGLIKSALEIRNGHHYPKYSAEERHLINDAETWYSGFIRPNMYIIDDYSTTVEDIRGYVEGLIGLTHKKPVVIIDYLHKISSPKDSNGKELRERIDDIVRGLRNIAKEFHVPVIAISSLNRASGTRKQTLEMSAFKESGGIEYDADVVIMLDFQAKLRESYDEKQERSEKERAILFSVLKQRDGMTGDIDARFYPKENRYEFVGMLKRPVTGTEEPKEQTKPKSAGRPVGSGRKKERETHEEDE